MSVKFWQPTCEKLEIVIIFLKAVIYRVFLKPDFCGGKADILGFLGKRANNFKKANFVSSFRSYGQSLWAESNCKKKIF